MTEFTASLTTTPLVVGHSAGFHRLGGVGSHTICQQALGMAIDPDMTHGLVNADQGRTGKKRRSGVLR
ncbi:MAG: hypothetical protein CBB71_08735 [Rhodopirellula sp. TMED11]|nr:MAG: hypothetical protein CBB71_08735 [Rhodopirellula sp. TMED11]